MKTLTYTEYKEIHKKLTKTQRAYYETKYNYTTRLNEEIILQELEDFKKEIQEWKEKTLKKIRAEKFLENHPKASQIITNHHKL